MFRAYKYRIYPTREQASLLNKHIGSVRFVYNLALETKQVAYASKQINLSRYDLQSQLPELKKECPWLKEVNSQSLQSSLMNLDAAYLSFFKGKGGFPKFKKKSDTGSFNIPQNVSLDGGLSIPKFKKPIKISISRQIKGTIKQATISRVKTGKYFVSILCDTDELLPVKPSIDEKRVVGIDLGIKTFIVTSDGKEFQNPRILRKLESKIKYTQRKYSKNKGKRTKRKLALLHEKVANQRKDFLHKVSTELIRDNQSIAIESLGIEEMLKNHCVAKSISDAGWGVFVSMLEYKSDWYGKNILKIGRFEPSSKTCSCCGSINKNLTLKDRNWTCARCGALHDRDVNAAINIKNFALNKVLSGTDRKNQNELPTLVGVLTSEAAK